MVPSKAIGNYLMRDRKTVGDDKVVRPTAGKNCGMELAFGVHAGCHLPVPSREDRARVQAMVEA